MLRFPSDACAFCDFATQSENDAVADARTLDEPLDHGDAGSAADANVGTWVKSEAGKTGSADHCVKFLDEKGLRAALRQTPPKMRRVTQALTPRQLDDIGRSIRLKQIGDIVIDETGIVMVAEPGENADCRRR